MLTFDALYQEVVARFNAGPDLLHSDPAGPTANSLYHVALTVADERVTSVEASAELLVDMAMHFPYPSDYYETEGWIDLAKMLFANIADDQGTADPVLAAENRRRDALAPPL